MKMKIFESTFDEYINKNKELHPYLKKYTSLLPNNFKTNIIFYGPKGIGKYTQVLNYIKKFSPTRLKYERKINITNTKKEYIFKISDIHFEIDIELLGCNAKILWNDIYYQIIDIVSSSPHKKAFIVCKNFHCIHNELLDIFYSYMQTLYHMNIELKYIFITEHISFIPDNILKRCTILPLKRPTKTMYNKCLKKKIPKSFNISNITNIKLFKTNNFEINSIFHNICNKIINDIQDYKNIHFISLRDHIYDLFIYQLNINDCLWYIISKLIDVNNIKEKNTTKILLKTYIFFKYFNNNYRPIYHLENLLLFICKEIHEF